MNPVTKPIYDHGLDNQSWINP